MRSTLFLGLALILVAGCGSKGPLVLPPKPAAAAPSAPQVPVDHSSKAPEAAK
jgi:predicted small lipoprotein YifL